MLIGVAGLKGDNLHGGASSPTLGGLGVNEGHDTGEGVARSDRGQVFVSLFPMQHPLQLDPQAGLLLHFLRIAPKGEDRREGGHEGHIGIADRLSRFPTLIDGSVIANRQRYFLHFAASDLDGERGKSLTNLARIKHSDAPSGCVPLGGTSSNTARRGSHEHCCSRCHPCLFSYDKPVRCRSCSLRTRRKILPE